MCRIIFVLMSVVIIVPFEVEGRASSAIRPVIGKSQDHPSPAELRNRRDMHCDEFNGLHRCSSIQCDPKYGWCTECIYDWTTGNPGKVEHPRMKCNYVPIDNGAPNQLMMPTTIFLLLASIISPIIFHFFDVKEK